MATKTVNKSPDGITHWRDDRGLIMTDAARKKASDDWKAAFCTPGMLTPKGHFIVHSEDEVDPRKDLPLCLGQFRGHPKWLRAHQRLLDAHSTTEWLSAMYWYLTVPSNQVSVLDESKGLDPGQKPRYKWMNHIGSEIFHIQVMADDKLIPDDLRAGFMDAFEDFRGLPVVYKESESPDKKPMALMVKLDTTEWVSFNHPVQRFLEISPVFSIYSILR